MAAKKLHRWRDLRAKKFTPEEIARIDAEVERHILEMNLTEMRELVGKTQADVAAAADMTQGEVSRLEAREDYRLSTLRRYAKALGGEVEIHFVFENRSVKLPA